MNSDKDEPHKEVTSHEDDHTESQTRTAPKKNLYSHSTGPTAEQIPVVIELQRYLQSLLLWSFLAGIMSGAALMSPVIVTLFAIVCGLWAFTLFVTKRPEIQKTVQRLRMKWRKWELESMVLTEFLLGALLAVCCKLLSASLLRAHDSLFGSVSTNFYLLLIVLCLYHKGEFLMVLQYHPLEVSWHAYLIYHSKAYTAANLIMFAEFFLEVWLVRKYKSLLAVPMLLVGGLLAITGLVIRNVSFHTAKSNFHHLIRYQRDTSHNLITHGIYSLERHPAYLGFFLQTIGLQLLICNPVTLVTHFFALRRFFRDRIEEEEETLQFIFGQQYIQYCKRVNTHLWFARQPPQPQEQN